MFLHHTIVGKDYERICALHNYCSYLYTYIYIYGERLQTFYHLKNFILIILWIAFLFEYKKFLDIFLFYLSILKFIKIVENRYILQSSCSSTLALLIYWPDNI